MLTVNEYRRGNGEPENPPQTISDLWYHLSCSVSSMIESPTPQSKPAATRENEGTREMVGAAIEK